MIYIRKREIFDIREKIFELVNVMGSIKHSVCPRSVSQGKHRRTDPADEYGIYKTNYAVRFKDSGLPHYRRIGTVAAMALRQEAYQKAIQRSPNSRVYLKYPLS